MDKAKTWIMWVVVGVVCLGLIGLAVAVVFAGDDSLRAQLPGIVQAVVTLLGFAAGHLVGGRVSLPPASSSSSPSSTGPNLASIAAGAGMAGMGWGVATCLPLIM